MSKIITVPNPILRKKSKSVSKIDKKVLKLVKELEKTLNSLKELKGVGLSAVQIGQLLRIFLARPDPDSSPQVFINPQIIWKSKELTNGVPGRKTKFEGCLSVPNYYGLIKRAKKIKLKYTTLSKDQRPKTKTRAFSGFLATVIQHEIDHLNGILFVDRVLEQENKLYKLEEDTLVETAL